MRPFAKIRQIHDVFRLLAVVSVIVLLGSLIRPNIAQEPATQDRPTKARMIADLKQIFSLMDNRDFAAAADFFLLPPNFKPEMLDGFIARQELSLDGILRLEREAKFGSAIERFGDQRGKFFADKAGTDPAKVFGFNHEAGGAAAEVLAIWNGSKYTFIRIDDVGKLPAIGEAPTQPMKDADPKTAESTPQPPTLDELSQQLPALEAEVEAQPENVTARAQYAMALYRLGNVPEAWVQLRAAYKLFPEHNGIRRGIQAVLQNFEKRGVFGVGVPTESILGILGDPDQKVDLTGRQRWVYAFYGVDFKQDRVHELVDLRGATTSLFLPTETISVDLDGRAWRCGVRKKAQKSSAASYFLPGESPSEWTEQFEIERILNASAMGTCEKIAEILVNQIKKVQPQTQSRVLESSDDSIILMTIIPGIGTEPKRHQLIRLMKGPQDLHRMAITIKADQPAQEYQQQWLAIMKSAQLVPTNLPDGDK